MKMSTTFRKAARYLERGAIESLIPSSSAWYQAIACGGGCADEDSFADAYFFGETGGPIQCEPADVRVLGLCFLAAIAESEGR